MKSIRKILQRILYVLQGEMSQKLRAKELLAWAEMQIASQMVEENFSQEQQKMSELIVHHARQMNHIIFSIEDVIPNEPLEKVLEQEKKYSAQKELKLLLRETKTVIQFLKELFSLNPSMKIKRTVPNKIKEIEIALHSLDRGSNTLRNIHKRSLQEFESKAPWQDFIVSLLEELYRLETTLKSMKSILLQSRQGRYGNLLESAEVISQITTQREEIHGEIEKINKRIVAATEQRKKIEDELHTIEQSRTFQEINDLQSQEKEMAKQLEKIEDKLFLFFSRLKNSLSDLADLNSDYELLEIITEIESLQEDPLRYFRENVEEKLLPLLNWILAKLASEDLQTPDEEQHPFEPLYQELVSSDMKTLEEQFQMLSEEKKSLPRRKMQHPMYANAQNLRYKRDHYRSQEEKLEHSGRKQRDKLGIATTRAMQYKLRFERFAKEHFDKDIEIELR